MKLPLILISALVAISAPSSALAFCGFYVGGGDAKLFNDATQVVLMRHGTSTVLSMQNNYQGPATDFAMVVPVPQVLQKENVKTLDKALFDKIDKLSAPRLVEYWEQDPCYVPPPPRLEESRIAENSAPMPTAVQEPKVVVEAQFKVGEYDIVILSATEATALDTWLRNEKYNIPPGAEPLFKPYIEAGEYFFVAKVDVKKVKYADGRAVLSPLRFSYESEKFSLPIRLGMINSSGQQDLIAYILGAGGQRYELANYANVTIPTNLEVSDGVRERFGGFYQALFSKTMEQNPKSVVTEYSWTTSGCDPCPGPALGFHDLQMFGLDAIQGAANWGWNLTRLHARYSKADIGEDLIFREAKPITGGRERWGEDGVETGATESSTNAFQGRYIIRHEWSGEVKCDAPRRGVWGGPNGHGAPNASAAPSANTEGAAPRAAKLANLDLSKLLRQSVPALKMEFAADKVLKPSPPPTTPVPVAKKEGCSTTGGQPEGTSLLLLLLGLLAVPRRVRRRRIET